MVRQSKVLLVGVGGIGCEILKELVMAGIREVHLVDLDSIDLSNLNRQFLFRKEHIGKSKAIVASETASAFNPDVKLIPHLADITDPSFSPSWFAKFSLVFNALDNAHARRHVNRMAVFSNVPLLDCGTAGFAGQVQVILPSITECYDCHTHTTPKSYPVCTIRSTPSQPVHCVVWAKDYLFNSLFGEPESENSSGEPEDDDAERKQQQAVEKFELHNIRETLSSVGTIEPLIQQVFVKDVERLLSLDELWKQRKKPTPLVIPAYDDVDVLVVSREMNKIWTVPENLAVFVSAVKNLLLKMKLQQSLSFDKDDEDSLNFVTSAANLRAHIFGVTEKSKFDIKEIAGNIIPAIATTNACIAGVGMIEALKILTRKREKLRSVYIFKSPNQAFASDCLAPPNPQCPTCSKTYAKLTVTEDTTVSQFIDEIVRKQLGYGEVALISDRLIYDPDYDQNLSRTLHSLNLVGHFLTVVDDDDQLENIDFFVELGSSLSCEQINVPKRMKRKREHSDSIDDGSDPTDESTKNSKRQELDHVLLDEDDEIVVLS